ncbi:MULTISPECIES: LysR substrate-binding domain-containing protein [Ralstonia solanacearum species complex]|uniref:LysR substrate-binding domain-containing protein n=1 Tax=Ralstonia solanacearum species complex TaxID=3116862 RepID=UPI001E5272DA|nr:LysR substrate-binding domain-containing protein [Ralstonia solanacearum]
MPTRRAFNTELLAMLGATALAGCATRGVPDQTARITGIDTHAHVFERGLSHGVLIQPSSALDEGRLDFAFGRMSKAAGQGVGRYTLFKDRYAVLIRAGHPLAGHALSRKDFAAAGQALICTSGHRAIEDVLVKMGARIALRLPSFLVVSRIVETSDLMVIVPARLAEQCAATGLFHTAALPVAIPAFDVSLFWSESRCADPAHAWMRGLLQQLFGQRDAA